MKMGINLLIWASEVTEELNPVVEQLKEIGYDSVELPVFGVDDPTPYARMGEKLKSLELEVTAVTIVQPECDPISAEASVREAAVERFRKALTCCQAAGVSVAAGPLYTPLGKFTNVAPTEDEFKYGVETMQKVGEVARETGVRLGVEPLNRFETYFLNTAAQAKRFVDAIDHPMIGILYDSFHAHIEEKNQATGLRTVGERLCHIHVSENDRGIPGTGQVDWTGFFETLKAMGYDGHFTIESFGRAMPEIAAATRVWRDLFPDAMQMARDGLAFMQSRLQG